MVGTLTSESGKIYDLDTINNCIDRLLETLKKELPEEAHTYEIYNHCLIEAENRIKTKRFNDL